MQYYAGRNGQQSGPFTEEQIKAKAASGELSITDLVWCEGMGNWEPLGRVFPSNNPYQPSVTMLDKHGAGIREGDGTQPAGRGARLGAYMLDNALTLLACLPVFPFLVWYMEAAMENRAISGEEMMTRFSPHMLILSVGLGLLLLVWNLVWLTTRGQTIGKRLTGIRIVRYEDGGHAGFVKVVLLRTLLMLLPRMVAGIFFDIADALFIFRDDRRCLHDLIAGTKVVSA